jgi:hypothetical protein
MAAAVFRLAEKRHNVWHCNWCSREDLVVNEYGEESIYFITKLSVLKTEEYCFARQ